MSNPMELLWQYSQVILISMAVKLTLLRIKDVIHFMTCYTVVHVIAFHQTYCTVQEDLPPFS